MCHYFLLKGWTKYSNASISHNIEATLYVPFPLAQSFLAASCNLTWPLYLHQVFDKIFKVALGVSPQFFSRWAWVLNQNKYVEIKQFSKEDIKQNNISTVILLSKFLVYQWDPRHLQGSRVVYIFIYTLYSCSI